MQKPTLQSLADQLGVSRQTVSNAINAPRKVRPDTLQRVLAEVRRTGYRPSAAAKALRTRQSNTIGLRLPNSGDGINGQVMDDFLHALTTSAGQHGYRILLFTASDPLLELEELERLSSAQSMDGCILTDTRAGDPRPRRLQADGVPFAAFGRPWRGEDNHSWVDVDGRAGVAAGVEHLRALGADPIGFIGWPDEAGTGVDRRLGWVDATGYDPKDQVRFSEMCEDSLTHGSRAMRRLLERGVRAVAAASDSLAVGAAHVLQQQGLPPLVTGYDDTPVAKALGISSLRQPVREAARIVLEMLLERINDPDARPRTQLLVPDLVARTPAAFNDSSASPTDRPH